MKNHLSCVVHGEVLAKSAKCDIAQLAVLTCILVRPLERKFARPFGATLSNGSKSRRTEEGLNVCLPFPVLLLTF